MIKQFLRDLDEPLCQANLYEEFLAAGGNKGKLMKVLEKMELANYSTLMAIVLFMRYICEASYSNNMTVSNLSCMFTPAIFRNPLEEITIENLNDIKKLSDEVMSVLVENVDDLF